MIQLRDYQNAAIDGLREAYRFVMKTLLVLPTGGGKTVIFSSLAQRAVGRGNQVMILAHRDELLEQIHGALRGFQISAQIVSGGMRYDARYKTHVASVFTIARRIDKIVPPDFLIIDEAHHVTPETVWGKVIAGLIALNPKMRVLGVTATPCRLSGEGLGESFEEMVIGPRPAELIELGWLSKYRMFGPPPGEAIDMSAARTVAGEFRAKDVDEAVDRPVIHGSAVAHYRKYCPGAPGLAFCPSIKAAEHTAEAFRAAGYSAAAIDGTMKAVDRKRVVRDFGAGDLQVMTSCALVSEGFDVPRIVAAFMLNPTQSLGKWLQECGRPLRIAPGKTETFIFDHAGNAARHGLPDDDREWTLEGAKKKKKSDSDEVPIKQCPKCYAVCRPTMSVCPHCGWKFDAMSRKVVEVDGDLAEVDLAAARKTRKVDTAVADAWSLDALVTLAKDRGYAKPEGWAMHIMAARAAKRKGGKAA